MAKPIITRQQFRKWLNEKIEKGDTNYPIHADSCRCPLARFLNDSGYQGTTVGSLGFVAGGKWRSHPRWAERFVDAVDLLPGRKRPVSFTDCRRILNRVTRGQRGGNRRAA